jgi:tetratricopeptide (TPR) repeat protein
MKKSPLIAAIACAVIGLSAGYVMIPGQSEQLAMLSRDGRPEAALEKADELFDAGNHDPPIVMQAFALNEYAGEYDRALKAFHTYFEMLPDDSAAWGRAAAIFDSQGQTALMNTALENIVRLTRSPAAAGQLAGYYRLNGRLDDEFRVMRAVDAKDLPAPDALRLSGLLLSRGPTNEGSAILERLDDTEPGLADDGRVQLFIALIEQRKYDAAADRAIKWNKESKNSPLQDVLTGYLLSTGADKAALRLVVGTHTFADATEFARVAGLLSDQGRFDLVEQLLSRWLGGAKQMPFYRLDGYIQEVVSVASGKGLTTKLFNELLRALDKGGEARIKASFVQAMYVQFGYAGVAPFRRALRPEVLLERPVLAARLMAAERNPLAARRFLFSVHLPDLSASAQFDWLGLAQEILSPQELSNELARRAYAGAVPSELRKAVLDAVIRVDSQPQIAEVWQAFFGANQTNSPKRISGVLIADRALRAIFHPSNNVGAHP